MDRFGSFDRDQGQDLPHVEQDAAIEAPPAIGTDERRMHVRAYNHWVSLLDGRAYPSTDDLNPDNADFGSNSVLLDFTTGSENPSISFLGDALRGECDLPEDIATIADVPSRSLLSRLTDHYLQIIANRAPIGFEAEFVNHRGNNTFYRGILMPFSSDDDTIDFIYGVINWKEVAEDSLAVQLTDAVEQALAAAPIRPTETVAVWADGPSAEFAAPPSHNNDEDEPEAFVADGSEELADWLVAARDLADVAKQADGRSRSALYKALGQAYDFALVADERPHDYSQLLDDSGITSQERAPMTPIVKLVFGIDYDKTRLAEFSSALSHARSQGIARGSFTPWIERHSGGLKGVVQAERATRRPERTADATESPAVARARSMTPIGVVALDGDSEFVVLVARRIDAGHVAVLGVADDDALVAKALRKLSA
jgi:hypothetical protein